jgi:hypothetical protein
MEAHNERMMTRPEHPLEGIRRNQENQVDIMYSQIQVWFVFAQ